MWWEELVTWWEVLMWWEELVTWWEELVTWWEELVTWWEEQCPSQNLLHKFLLPPPPPTLPRGWCSRGWSPRPAPPRAHQGRWGEGGSISPLLTLHQSHHPGSREELQQT